MKNKASKKIIVFTFFYFFVLLTPAVLAADDVWKVPEIEVQFPQQLFKDTVTCDTPDSTGAKLCHVPWIADYISAIYSYAVGVVGILAVVVMMMGGIIWMTAGGSAGRIGEAKSWITAALTGLVLILASYTILYTVNPDLVNLKFINIKTVALPQATTGATCIWIAQVWNGTEDGGATQCNAQYNTPVADTTRCPAKTAEQTANEKNTVYDCCCPSLDASQCIPPYPCTACDNCANAQSLGLACKQNNTSCYLNQDFINELAKLKQIDSSWQITEGWPPHASHSSLCHQNGNCADINVTTAVTSDNVKKLYSELTSAGFSSFQIEASSCADYSGYKCMALSETGGTGVHIHVNK